MCNGRHQGVLPVLNVTTLSFSQCTGAVIPKPNYIEIECSKGKGECTVGLCCYVGVVEYDNPMCDRVEGMIDFEDVC